MCVTTKKGKKQKTYLTIFWGKNAELKGFDNGGQDILYGVDFLNCKAIICAAFYKLDILKFSY